MKARKIELSIYKNALENFHIHKVSGKCLAQEIHFHDYFQIYYVIKGNLTHFSKDDSSHLSYGDIFIIPPGYIHRISIDTVNTEFYSCSFDKTFINELIYTEWKTGKFLFNLIHPEKAKVKLKLSIPSSLQLHFKNLMDLMISEYQIREDCIETLKSCLTTVLTIITKIYYNEAIDDINIKFKDNKRAVLFCLDYLENNFSKNLTLDDMTRISRMQRSEFCTVFREISGLSFNTMLNKLRIEKALNIIKENTCKYPLNKISVMCGYQQFTTFYRNFIKFTGVNPNTFIKNHNS